MIKIAYVSIIYIYLTTIYSIIIVRDSFVIFFLTLSLIFRAYNNHNSISTYVYHDGSVVRHWLRNRDIFGSNPAKDTIFFLRIILI